jgi:hypothetical protein
MDINAYYSQSVVIHHHDLPWIASPESGLERRMLERQGDPSFTLTACILFVKMRHLGPDQVEREVIDTQTAPLYQGMVPGLKLMPLMQQGSGSTLVRSIPQYYFNLHRQYGGEEIFVVDGVFDDEHGRYPAGSWIRSRACLHSRVHAGRFCSQSL